MFSYDIALATYCRFLGIGEKEQISSITKTCSICDLDQLSPANAESKNGALLSGEVAAYLTLASILSTEGDANPPSRNLLPYQSRGTDRIEKPVRPTNSIRVNYDELALSNPSMFMMYCSEGYGPVSLQLPTLTDDEKDGPLGALMCYILGNFCALTQLIMKIRNERRRGNNPDDENVFLGKESIRKVQSNSASFDVSQQNPTSNSQDPRSGSNFLSRKDTFIRKDAYGIPYLPQASGISSTMNEHLGISSGSSSDADTSKQLQVGHLLDHSLHSLNDVLNDELALQIQRSFDSSKDIKGNIRLAKEQPNENMDTCEEKRERGLVGNIRSQNRGTFKESDIVLPYGTGRSNAAMPQYSKEMCDRKIHIERDNNPVFNYDLKQTAHGNASHTYESYPVDDKSDHLTKQIGNETSRSYSSNSFTSGCISSGQIKKKRSLENETSRHSKSRKK